jgi:hypothetical protein
MVDDEDVVVARGQQGKPRRDYLYSNGRKKR